MFALKNDKVELNALRERERESKAINTRKLDRRKMKTCMREYNDKKKIDAPCQNSEYASHICMIIQKY